QHMAPHHESALAHLLTASTNLPVLQPAEDIRLKVDHIYVVPPNRSLALNDGKLLVQPRPTDRSQFTPVDAFFQSLASELGADAIGVILSGTASDGVEGVHAIKAAGGIAIAQDPETAKQDGMPRAAISTGKVDLVLSPPEMAGELVRLARQSPGHARPPSRPDALL